ncbi:hypothetical protein E2I00_018883 [Balaenoptera physalus]|uniref:Uncharacterized protein n=1 Tax=Balaenoptera physalus TaxID=9770 RepID=A0A6A1QDG5_BALPH|nr:hypothetical protein E2I00_018883 [Balaenoptera physalus]
MRTRRAKTRESRDPSLEAHIKALRSRLFLLPVCGVLLRCLHLGAFADAVAQQDRGRGLCRDTGSLPSGHTVILISGNAKLKGAVETILLQAQSSLKVRADRKADPRMPDLY